jgi:hypothetical protein
MLSLQNKQLNSIFERIIRDSNGVLVRVRFTVVEVNGVFKGQVISAEPLVSKAENTETGDSVVCLPCLKDNKIPVDISNTGFETILSPYFSLEFFMSQPTRAPAFAI